ncbi:MAG: hypothetical protein OXJ52_05430 [Oligoflexia bacterium]|nr:hypothetical protein [Oligoflexia bacterium]
MKKVYIFFVVLFFITAPMSLSAKKRSKKGRVVEINFDDELLIKGKLLGPSLFTLYQKRNVEFGKLIKPRKNFLPEMRATLGDIK